MRKATLTKIITIVPGSLLVILFSLSIFGRQVGPKPLPWHVAWIAPFGDWGERFSYEWAIQHAESKQEIIEIWGEPIFVVTGSGTSVTRATEIDLYEERVDESWLFGTAPDRLSGRVVRFANNQIIGR